MNRCSASFFISLSFFMDKIAYLPDLLGDNYERRSFKKAGLPSRKDKF